MRGKGKIGNSFPIHLYRPLFSDKQYKKSHTTFVCCLKESIYIYENARKKCVVETPATKPKLTWRMKATEFIYQSHSA